MKRKAHVALAIMATLKGILGDARAEKVARHTAKKRGVETLEAIELVELEAMAQWLGRTDPQTVERMLVERYEGWAKAQVKLRAKVGGVVAREYGAPTKAAEKRIVELYHESLHERLKVASYHELEAGTLKTLTQAVTLAEIKRAVERAGATKAEAAREPEVMSVEEIAAARPSLETPRADLWQRLHDVLAVLVGTTTTGEWVVTQHDLDMYWAEIKPGSESDWCLEGLVGALEGMGREERARYVLDSISGELRSGWAVVEAPPSDARRAGAPDPVAALVPDLRTRINGAIRRPEDTIESYT